MSCTSCTNCMSSTHSLYLSFPVSLFSITNPQKQQKKSIQQSDSNPNRALVKYFIHTRKNKRTHFTQNYYTLKKVNNNPWRRQHCRNNNKSHTHTHAHTDQSHVRVRFCLSVMSVQMSRARVTGENGEKIQHTFLV